jgi:hypothetical protein
MGSAPLSGGTLSLRLRFGMRRCSTALGVPSESGGETPHSKNASVGTGAFL